MQFNIKYEDKRKSRSIDFEDLKALMAFIMGCDCPVLLTPNWQSNVWDLELKSEATEE